MVAQHVAPVETSRERNELALRLQNLQEEKTMLLTEINDLRLNQNTLYNEVSETSLKKISCEHLTTFLKRFEFFPLFC